MRRGRSRRGGSEGAESEGENERGPSHRGKSRGGGVRGGESVGAESEGAESEVWMRRGRLLPPTPLSIGHPSPLKPPIPLKSTQIEIVVPYPVGITLIVVCKN
jgi:hypothetical protein